MSVRSLIDKGKRAVGPVISVLLFTVAAWVLYHELKGVRLHQILQAINGITGARVLGAVGVTALSYGIMSCYDVLALRYVHHALPYRKIGLASFVGYTLSNNVGLSMIAGASVRYRLYSAWGLSTEEITKVVVFCSLSLWLGFFFLGGTVFTAFPPVFPTSVHVPLGSVRVLGAVMLAVVLGYFLVIRLRKTPVTIKEWEFEPPSLPLTVFQIAVALLDWLLAAAVLYLLLSAFEPIPFSRFMEFYLMAQLLGLASQVPGGLGVFETVMVLLLSSFHPAQQVFAALLVYRLIYYWMPLIVAVVLLGGHEYAEHQALFRRFGILLGKWVSPILPMALGIAVTLGGMILLFSGATPAIEYRMQLLKPVLPLSLIELSHFIGSLVGMGLILLGRGIQRRLDAAWVLTLLLLAVGIVASLMKGLDFEEASILALIVLAMLPVRGQFYRKASLFSERLSGGWIAAILVAVGASVWLGLFSYRHVAYRHDLWWRFSFNGDAPRFLRASVGVTVTALLFAVARLLRAAPPRGFRTAEGLPEGIEEIVLHSPYAAANLAFLQDKRFLFDEGKTAFIMYGVFGRSWVAMGDPVGPETAWPELIWEFKRLANRFGAKAVFYEVAHRNLHYYLDVGLTLLKLGEEARVPLTEFSLEGSRRKALRYIHRKLEQQGCGFQILTEKDVLSEMAVLQEISDAWLLEKNTREKRFSLGNFNPSFIRRFPVAVVRHEERIVAFATIWKSAEKRELTVDLMRYRPEALPGIMDYLFIEMMLWGREQGYRWFSLGMAPLAGVESRSNAPLWHKIGGLVTIFGDHFYNFRGLRQYKHKFAPVWRPKYLACPGGFALPRILTDVVSLTSGGIKGVLMK